MALALHKGGLRLMRVQYINIKILYKRKLKYDLTWDNSLLNQNKVLLKAGSKNKIVFITGFFIAVRNLSDFRCRGPPIQSIKKFY